MKQKYIFLALIFSILGACYSTDKAVNSRSTLPVYPMGNVADIQGTQAAMSQSSQSAIEGKVFLRNDVPTPIKNLQIALLKKLPDQKWIEISRLSTEGDGSFRFTQKLGSGVYEIKIVDNRYLGSLKVTLEESPMRDLVLMAMKK